MAPIKPWRLPAPLAAQPRNASKHPLAALFPLPAGQAKKWLQHQGRALLLLEHPRFQAAFSRQGGQLLHFQPRGQRPWLWCASHWPRGGAIRGGVPVCWPWFGRHPSESGWPSHGWARLCDWTVTLEAELGEQMRLRLRTSHQDSEPCRLSQALHAYWQVSDVARVA